MKRDWTRVHARAVREEDGSQSSKEQTPYDGVLSKTAKIDAFKTGMLLYEPFGTGYVTLGERGGTPWSEGRKYMK